VTESQKSLYHALRKTLTPSELSTWHHSLTSAPLRDDALVTQLGEFSFKCHLRRWRRHRKQNHLPGGGDANPCTHIEGYSENLHILEKILKLRDQFEEDFIAVERFQNWMYGEW